MKKKFVLTACAFLLTGTFIFSQTLNKDYVDGAVYFKIKKEVPFVFDTLHRDVNINSRLSFLAPLLAKYNISRAESPFYFSKSDVLKRTFRLYFNNIKLVDRLTKELQLMNVIEYAEKVPLDKLSYTPNDNYFSDNSVNGQWGLYKIDAEDAWNVTRGSRFTHIAIVDNAVDTSHQDLKPIVYSARDVADGDNNTKPPQLSGDSWEHGTHTSGTACAATNNVTGVASIGFSCSLIAVKAQNNSGDGRYISSGYAGISWAVANGANVISCSWGDYGYSTTNQNVITDAYNNNVVVVAAAGNDNLKNTILYPAGYDHAIAVAATDINDQKASFSNYGSWIDVSAPGVTILSTFPGNQYGYFSGTSMATPLVAGLCGLVKSVNPSLNVDQVINIVKANCDNIDAANPAYSGLLGYGRINAYKTVESALACNGSLNLGSGYYYTPKTESSGSITSGNSIANGAAVILDAATTITLLPGFHAYPGSSLDAYIDGCGNKVTGKNEKAKFISKTVNTDTNSVSVANSNSNKLSVYPNPTSSIIHLNLTTAGNESNVVVQVFTAEMRQVKEIKIGNLIRGRQNTTINLSDLASGMYFITVQLQAEKLVAKVLVVK